MATFTELDNITNAGAVQNSVVRIDDTHFIVAYEGGANDGFISTYSVDGSGNITVIDTLEHDTAEGRNNSLVMIDATHFMLAYRGDAGKVKTFSIDGSYNITEIDSITFNSGGRENSLAKIDATHYVNSYRDGANDGRISVFSIDGSYNITELTEMEHDSSSANESSLVMIDTTHFIIAYAGNGLDGFIKTFSINGSYVVTEIASLEHDTSNGRHNSLVMIDSTHFMLAYIGSSGSDGFVKTFSIDGSYGSITEIDSLEHDTTGGLYVSNSLIKVDDSYILAYYNPTDEYVKRFTLDGSYNITEADSLNYVTGASITTVNANGLALLNDDTLILGSIGKLITFNYDPVVVTSDNALSMSNF